MHTASRRYFSSLVALALCLAAIAGAQTPAAKSAAIGSCGPSDSAEAPLTRQQGAAILAALARIEDELSKTRRVTGTSAGPSPPSTIAVAVSPSWPALGQTDAPVTVIEFMDLQCPFCRQFATQSFQRLKADFIETGKIRFITRDLPLPMHPYSAVAAEAAACAGAQGKLWPFRFAVLAENGPPTPAALRSEAEKLGLDLGAYTRCVSSRQYQSQVADDASAAEALGIHGTPAFLIGPTVSGTFTGTLIMGNRPYADFRQAISAALSPKPELPAGKR